MTDSEIPRPPFQTVTMAQILLGQDLLIEAAEILDELVRKDADNPRVRDLAGRLEKRRSAGELVQKPEKEMGKDKVMIERLGRALSIRWELTDQGLILAKRKVRYSGDQIIRLFTAACGPRGVRKSTRDFELQHPAATMIIEGTPAPAVHVAAVGFLGRNGAFVPLASSSPLWNAS